MSCMTIEINVLTHVINVIENITIRPTTTT